MKKSVTADAIVCLEDGKKFKSLKRHLRTDHNLSPEEYRAKWGLPRDYPMVAPNYAASRSELAKKMGLGRGRQGNGATAATAEAARPRHLSVAEVAAARLRRRRNRTLPHRDWQVNRHASHGGQFWF